MKVAQNDFTRKMKILTLLQKLPKMWANELLPQALKSCRK